jgi:hypothetical protein
MADSAALLVDDVQPHQPMRQWVLSVPFPLSFLFASQPAVMCKVLGIIYRIIATHLTHKAGFINPLARTGAVTLIQRFGGALNLNIHFHMLFLDGVYIGGANGQPMRFLRVKAPTKAELTQITRTIAHRVARYLERQGLLERDTGNIYLTPEAVEKVRPGTGREAGLGHASDEDPSNQLLGSSITYRIAVGPQQGRKVFTLQTLPDVGSDKTCSNSVGETAGYATS